MPFVNEHRARQSSPDQFERFRRVKPEGFPSGVEAILGLKTDGSSEIQSVTFDAAQWQPNDAKKWLGDHNFTSELEEAEPKDDAITVRLDDLTADGATMRTVRRWDLLPLEKAEKTADGFVRAQGMITRKDAIDAVLGGKNKLSCGYTCQVVDRGGTFVDADQVEHVFDAIQQSIVGNHVAICDNPRAGPSAQIRIDEADAFADFSQPKGDAMETITINGQTYQVTKEVAAKMRADGVLELKKADTITPTPKPDDANARALAESQARADKAEGELAATKAKHADDDQKRTDAKNRSDQNVATKKRIALVAAAAPILEKKLDELLELDDAEIMRQVIAKQAPDVKLEGKSDAFIEGVFETIATTHVDTTAAITTLINQGKKTALNNGSGDDSAKRADDARQRMIDRDRNGWEPENLRKLEKAS